MTFPLRWVAFCALAFLGVAAAGARGQVIAAPPGAPQLPNPILFVTQIPQPADFTTIGSTFGNHQSHWSAVPRGGDLWIRYPNGTLKNLTASAGYGSASFQGATAIAVRDPSVHFSGTRALFSMVVGNASQQWQLTQFYWQIYEIVGLGLNDTPVITRVPNQPPTFNNITPLYGTDGRILFTSDRPRNGALHLYPQRDEYEAAPTVTGIWSLHPPTGDLFQVTHAPSGDFTPVLDSFGRVMFTRWDHLQRDQLADADFNSTQSQTGYGSYGTFNWAGEDATAPILPSRAEIFPEPRASRPDLLAGTPYVGHAFNHFFPWQVNEDGTDLETLNHIGRHELHNWFSKSRNGDPNVVDFWGPGTGRVNQNWIESFFQMKESAAAPGTYFGTDAPEFQTHASGRIVSITAPPGANPDQATITYITHPDTRSTTSTPTADHSGHYRDPLPLVNGQVVVAHTTETREDANTGTTANPGSRYAFRLKLLTPSGAYFTAGTALTPGITKSITAWNPDVLVSYSGNLWELQPVEVRARPVPPRRGITLESPELQAFQQTGTDLEAFRAYLAQNNLAVIVSRDVTSRDDGDRQQPFNLRVPNSTTQSVGAGGTMYDVSHLQLFQGDQIRGFGGTTSPWPGRRILAQHLHDPLVNNPTTPGAPPASVAVAPDGSVAAFVPARRALTWQLTDPTGEGVVRERYWLTFQPGEVRVCASCHGANTLDQTGSTPPTNPPQALTQLLLHWQSQNVASNALGSVGAGTTGSGAGGPYAVLSINGSTGGGSRVVSVPVGAPLSIALAQPPSNPNAAPFVMYGTLEIPQMGTTYPTVMGPIAIPPFHLYPSMPGLFVLANTYWSDPASLFPATLAPWTLNLPAGIGRPITLTLQGLIEDSPVPSTRFGVTNGIILQVY